MEPIYSQSPLDIAFIEIKKNFIESNKHKNWDINLCQISSSYLSQNPLLEEYILKSLNQQSNNGMKQLHTQTKIVSPSKVNQNDNFFNYGLISDKILKDNIVQNQSKINEVREQAQFNIAVIRDMDEEDFKQHFTFHSLAMGKDENKIQSLIQEKTIDELKKQLKADYSYEFMQQKADLERQNIALNSILKKNDLTDETRHYVVKKYLSNKDSDFVIQIEQSNGENLSFSKNQIQNMNQSMQTNLSSLNNFEENNLTHQNLLNKFSNIQNLAKELANQANISLNANISKSNLSI